MEMVKVTNSQLRELEIPEKVYEKILKIRLSHLISTE